jgi:endonuclease/exonuclease/phosphatase family metal-dependent hydrolase
MHRSRMTLSFLMLVSLLTPMAALRANESDREVKVATYNMYLGAELLDIFLSTSPEQLVAEVGEAYLDVQAGLPEERIDEISDQIASSAPDVVGLQEVALWRIGAPGDPASAETVAYDFLQMLLDSLAERGAHYAPVAIQTNLDRELTGFFPAAPPLDIRYTDRLVILVRTDMQTSRLKVEGSQTGTFQVLLPVLLLGTTPIEIPRGWASVDIKHRGKTYRFVNAHLEAFNDEVQFYQAYELLLGPANTDLPVILSGDFNSDPVFNGQSYSLLLSGGFTDVWTAAGPGGTGYTWPLSPESPAVILSPYQRVDYIMSRGAVTLSDIDVIGEDPVLDLTTPSSFRPSDHAGLTATVVLEP